MSVRAKFKVETKLQNTAGFVVNLLPVYSNDPTSENGKFYKYTPSGKIELMTINPFAAEAFVVGSEVYVDFTPVASN